VTVWLRVALAKLEIPPLKSKDFSLPQSGTQGDQEQRVIRWAVFFGSQQKSLGLLRLHRLGLVFRFVALYKSAIFVGSEPTLPFLFFPMINNSS
jgi:hypothetical protein